jgi:2-(1,2-epoxy-1,2-dihydrophenyl)acetyl-CoA isomerase
LFFHSSIINDRATLLQQQLIICTVLRVNGKVTTFAIAMEYILFNVDNGVAFITLNRPQVFNAMNHPMRQELIAVLEECGTRDDIRAIYLTGEGKAFCAGEDLLEVTDPHGPSLTEIISTGYNPIVLKIRTIEKPVVCAVNGVAAGAGANIALACDITVAKASASFTQAFSKIGLIPDSGGTWTLPRLVGFQRASALMMLSDKITAPDAAAMGMIWKAFRDDTFEEESKRIVFTLAQMPTRGLGLTKRALNQSFSNDFASQLEVEDVLQSKAGHTDDYREGVAAFIAKRKPVFKGK